MEWAAVDTLVELTKGNVDAAHTSWKHWKQLENCSRRHFSCKCYIKRRRSTLAEDRWKAAAVDIPVINITLNTDTDPADQHSEWCIH